MIQDLNKLFLRDFDRLKTELNAYVNEADLWIVQGGISNSAGNLALHLLGNTRHFIGHVLGGSGYTRNREAEFTLRNVPLPTLLEALEKAANEVSAALTRLTSDDLEKPYPINVFGYEMTTAHFMLHLLGHFDYHLGQINYHRRLLTQ